MGIKKIVLFLVFLCHLYILTTPSPHSKTMPPALLQENSHKDKKLDRTSNSGSNSGGSGIVRHNSVSHRGGAGSGGRAGGEADHGENGNNGGSESTTPSTAGAVIPLYAAGAANSHRPNNHHHSAGSRNWSCLGLPTLGTVILATVALHVNVVFKLWI